MRLPAPSRQGRHRRDDRVHARLRAAHEGAPNPHPHPTPTPTPNPHPNQEALRELDPSIPLVLQPGNHDIGQNPSVGAATECRAGALLTMALLTMALLTMTLLARALLTTALLLTKALLLTYGSTYYGSTYYGSTYYGSTLTSDGSSSAQRW